MTMHNPAHPGQLLRLEVFELLGVSVTEAAKRLGISRVFLSRVLNGKASVSPDLAVRLEASGLGKAKMWLSIQAAYDLWTIKQQPVPVVGQFNFPDLRLSA